MQGGGGATGFIYLSLNKKVVHGVKKANVLYVV